MNKMQELSLTPDDMPTIAGMIAEGYADNDSSHAKTQAMLGAVLNRIQEGAGTMPPVAFGDSAVCREYCNVFVNDVEKFDRGWFTVPKRKALVSFIEPEVKKRFFNIQDEHVVEQILSFPSLFMSENPDYMRSRPGQKALLGRVTDLELLKNDVKISFAVELQIFQQSVTNISQSLKLLDAPGCSELNDTHWTIKQIDLIAVLAENGLVPPQLTQGR
ncbi:hypothetical protein FACS18949_17130 [Clostridia bacterium]|nr:hypothetical protein FACS189425_05230 [Clostridia bacterium]GHV37064.1 hypothetical protein FACS18949_17130 [Clostridia bacterium]